MITGEELTWIQPVLGGVTPQPRSLHTAQMIDHKLYIFGGWTPLVTDESLQDDQWKVSSDLVCLNLGKNQVLGSSFSQFYVS